MALNNTIKAQTKSKEQNFCPFVEIIFHPPQLLVQ